MAAPSNPQIGNVRIHAYTVPLATPHRTAERRMVEPIPRMQDVMTWVVLTGTPVRDATSMTLAAEASAAKPCTGRILTIRTPRVRMTR